MHHDYSDITERIKEEPKWWDERAVPRYCTFAPNEVADIYADEAVLALITCQGCKREFQVAFSRSKAHAMLVTAARHKDFTAAWEEEKERTLANAIINRTLHYGDPPNYCCASGATMNSEPRRVLEYWRKQDDRNKPNWMQWVRDPALEIEIDPEWVNAT